MINLRQCEIIDHCYNPSTYLCMSFNCEEKSRFLCQTCLLKRFHNHNDGMQEDYIIELNNSQQIENILRVRLQYMQQQTYRKLKQYTKTMQQAIQYISQLMEDAQQKYENHLRNTIRLFQKVVNQSPFDVQSILRLSKEEIQKLLNINPQIIDLNLMDDQLQIIELVIEMFNQKEKDCQQIGANQIINIQESNIPINSQILNGWAEQKPIILDNEQQLRFTVPNNRSQKTYVQFGDKKEIEKFLNHVIDSQYSSHQIVNSSNNNLYHAEISPNEKYLVYGGKEQILYFYDLNKLGFEKQKIDKYISVCRFTEDSKILYVGCDKGFVYGFEVERNFRQIFKKQLLKDWIINIYCIWQEQIIISSEDSYVARFHINKSDNPIIAYCKDQGSLFGLEYDRVRDVIIVAGGGKSIIALDGETGAAIINQSQAHENIICQMQLINNQILITLDLDGMVKQWDFNYNLKRFEEFISYYDPANKIYGFYSILLNRLIVYIGEKSINIIDQNNSTIIKSIKFSAKGLFKYRQIHQSKFLKYLLVPCERDLFLFTRIGVV